MTVTGHRSATKPQVRVWDIGVRLFHWSLVAGVAASYLLADTRWLHKPLGYVVVGLVAFRIVWGFVGSRHARFSDFVPAPRRLIGYLADMFKGREERHLGHNPAGGAMILALLTVLSVVGGTGHMLGMSAYFGQSWVEDLHKAAVNLLLVLVALHVGGVILSSRRHGENLVRSMVTGRKNADDGKQPAE